jgi:hypothetical protein
MNIFNALSLYINYKVFSFLLHLQKYVHFLTHVHTDQIKGLTSSWRDFIYTSRTNANILVEMYKIDKGLFRVLEFNRIYKITLPLKKEKDKNMVFLVTILDACHIRGSCMMLFRGK